MLNTSGWQALKIVKLGYVYIKWRALVLVVRIVWSSAAGDSVYCTYRQEALLKCVTPSTVGVLECCETWMLYGRAVLGVMDM